MPRIVKCVRQITSLDVAQRTFRDWLFDFEAVDDAPPLLAILSDCDDELPPNYCDTLGLPEGSSFSQAAALLGAPWGLA